MIGRVRGDAGNAAVEFLTLGVLLMVPLLYLSLALARVQAASMAADRAAVLGARSFTLADSEPAGRRAVAEALTVAMRDHGFTEGGTATLRCAATPCLDPGARVEVQVRLEVPLPVVPRAISGALPAMVTVRAAQLATVDRFREVPT